MRKIFLTILLSFILILPVFAVGEDEDSASNSGVEGMMEHSNLFDNPFAGQKQITDEEFDKVYNQVKAKQDKKKKKNKKNEQIKGKGLNQENDGGYLSETADKTLVLTVPVELVNGDGKEIPVGHYKVTGEKLNNKIYLNFCQAHSIIAKVPAIETDSDFNQTNINFVQLIPYNEERIKVIYGSLDFNAYTFIKMKNKISDQN